MSGAGLIELLAARLGGRGARRAAPTLREALATLPERAPSSDLAWRIERPLFHASDASIDGPLRPTRRQGFPEPTGISFAETPQVAEQFGGAVYPHFARGELGNAEQFMARAREHMAQGLNSEQAAAATQKEFAELGYSGVRWGTGENVIFNSDDVISALDPQVARAGALSVRPPAQSAEQGASVLRDGTFMRSESDYVSAHQSLPAPTLREAVAERIGRSGPDAGPVQGENGTTLYRGSATGGRRGRWLTPDETAAADYGPVTSSVEDVSRATPIRDFGDLELALGNRSGVLGRMDERNADVWDALDDPAVQQALRDEGHSAVRLMDDVSPTGRRHESYLVLGRTAPDGGATRPEISPVVPPPPEGARRLYNASTVDHDPNGYLDPHVSGWVEEVANGAGDFDNIGDITRPLVYMSDNPESWVRMIVGRKIGRHPNDVTIEDIRAHGRLNIVDADPEYDNIFQVGEHSADDSVTTLGGERRRMWETNLYDSEDFREMPVGPEPDDFISREPVQVAHSLTGDDLVRFLEQNSRRNAPNGRPVQAGRDADDAASRFSYEGPNHNGARIYTVQVDNNHVARMEVHPDEIVQWSIRSVDGGTIGDLPVSQRSALALKALRGVQEALGSDARQFGVTAYTFYGDKAHSAAYRAMGNNAERYGFEMRETGPGAFELRQSPSRNAPNAGSDRNALQRALRERMERE